MRKRTMLGQKLISVSICPTTITSAPRLNFVNGIRKKSIPYLFFRSIHFLRRIHTHAVQSLVR